MTRPLQHTGPAANGDGGNVIIPPDDELDIARAFDREIGMRRRMARLGMDPRGDWCLIYTPAAVAAGQLTLRMETPDETRDIDAGDAAWLRDWGGYGFELFGRVSAHQADTGRPDRFIFERRQDTSTYEAIVPGAPAIVAEIWQLRAAADRHGFFAEFRWHPLAGWDGPFIGGPWRDGYDEAAVKRARTAVLLLLAARRVAGGGRRRIEDDPEKMAAAEQAVEIWRREPQLTPDQLAERVGLYHRVPPLEDPGRTLKGWIGRYLSARGGS
jgi:hypothetical protein